MGKEPCRVIAVEHLSLDGVYQAPARSDEDTRNGFSHGGWAASGDDPEMQSVIGKYMAGGWSLLVGRTTYEDLFEGWPVRQPTSPMTKALTGVQKFVASRNADYRLPWENSTLLRGDAGDAVTRLKKDHKGDLVIFGSGVLVRSLMRAGAVDELVLMIHPLVLGEGFRLFDADSGFAKLSLCDSVPTKSGVLIAIYRAE
jgi:dihydrofolate reductase